MSSSESWMSEISNIFYESDNWRGDFEKYDVYSESQGENFKDNSKLEIGNSEMLQRFQRHQALIEQW